MVGEEVEAEDDGGEVGGEEDVDEIGDRVVVVGDQGVRGCNRVLPGHMQFIERGGRVVDGIAVENVGEHLKRDSNQHASL